MVDFRFRFATRYDVKELTDLIAISVNTLQAGDYTPEQMKGATGSVFGVDTQLIDDQTYFVIEAGDAIIACGGWSKRKTLFGSDHATDRDSGLLDPKVDAAKIRAFFVHPDWARRGLGTRLLEACEFTASEEGFTRFEMGATLTGVRLYAARGYVEVERTEVPLPNGVSLPAVRMVKG